MKLTEEVLEEGRVFVRAQDLEGLLVWHNKHVPTVTASEVEKTFKLLFTARDPERALKLFDRFYTEVDPAAHVRSGLMRLGCILFVALGALGGAVYLFRAIF